MDSSYLTCSEIAFEYHSIANYAKKCGLFVIGYGIPTEYAEKFLDSRYPLDAIALDAFSLLHKPDHLLELVRTNSKALFIIDTITGSNSFFKSFIDKKTFYGELLNYCNSMIPSSGTYNSVGIIFPKMDSDQVVDFIKTLPQNTFTLLPFEVAYNKNLTLDRSNIGAIMNYHRFEAEVLAYTYDNGLRNFTETHWADKELIFI